MRVRALMSLKVQAGHSCTMKRRLKTIAQNFYFQAKIKIKRDYQNQRFRKTALVQSLAFSLIRGVQTPLVSRALVGVSFLNAFNRNSRVCVSLLATKRHLSKHIHHRTQVEQLHYYTHSLG